MEVQSSRVRMSFGANAKGLVQMDLTVEFPTVSETASEARKAIDEYRAICSDKKITLVDAVTPA